MAKTDKALTDLSYEQAFNELAEIVTAMEGQQQPLDEAMKLFERGQALAQHCTDLLDKAELKIRELNTLRSPAGNEE